MKILTPGHRYELANFERTDAPGQVLQFIEKEKRCEPGCSAVLTQGAECDCEQKFATVNDGTTNEEVLAMLINRLLSLYAKLPSEHTLTAIGMLRAALNELNKRTAARIARGVEGTPKP
jgi:hypothetical protein